METKKIISLDKLLQLKAKQKELEQKRLEQECLSPDDYSVILIELNEVSEDHLTDIKNQLLKFDFKYINIWVSNREENKDHMYVEYKTESEANEVKSILINNNIKYQKLRKRSEIRSCLSNKTSPFEKEKEKAKIVSLLNKKREIKTDIPSEAKVYRKTITKPELFYLPNSLNNN